MWDYAFLQGFSDQATFMLPDDDGSYLNLYNSVDSGDPGLSLFGLARESFGDIDPGVPFKYDTYDVEFSPVIPTVRDTQYHFAAYRKSDGGQDSIRLTRISKISHLLHNEYTIYTAAAGETVDSASVNNDFSQNLHCAFRIFTDDTMSIAHSNSVDQGATWTTPVIAFSQPFSSYGIHKDMIGIISTLVTGRIFITYANGLYLYAVYSDDGGGTWSHPSSPYEGQLPLGHHMTQPYPAIDLQNVLHLFYIAKNEQWQFGSLALYTME